MSSRFDICLLLYVIRLAGWLKHCNLSLSLTGSALCSREACIALLIYTGQVNVDLAPWAGPTPNLNGGSSCFVDV